jgi:phosphatidate phosphatase APP1
MTHSEINNERTSSPNTSLKKWGQLLLRRFRIKAGPAIKVYHGFGTAHHMELSGHVFGLSPIKQEKFSTRFWRNTLSLLQLFVVKPLEGAAVEIIWGNQRIPARADATGFFHAEWDPEGEVRVGWHDVMVVLKARNDVIGYGKIVVPPPTKYAIASDIDDTFLISHSGDILKRLYVLLTSNARTRRPFTSVVEHYQLLARGDKDGALRPLFYVSSSEWNLYDYIREFADSYRLPDGVYLLSTIKQLHQFWKTGQGKHKAKYFKIARIMVAYPEKQFILLGDDSQEDPTIYSQLVKDFPGRIICVYLRHVRKEKLEATRLKEAEIKKAGVEICYFTHSKTAIEHSRRVGLIK